MNRVVRGVGLALREELADALLAENPAIDWLELTPENWITFGGKTRRTLEACTERWATVPHGVSLSVAGPDPLDEAYIDAVRAFCRANRCPWWSDHLAWTSANGAQLGDLLPFPYTDEFVEHVSRRVREAESRLGVELLVENAAAYARLPHATMHEAAFLRAVAETAGCGILLDVNNVYVNALNHRFDPFEYIDQLPIERVREVHLAGHTVVDGTAIDSHDRPVAPPVWDLYDHALRRARRPIPTLLEWDADLPPLEVLLEEVGRVRAHLALVDRP